MKRYRESHIPDHWAIRLFGSHWLFKLLTGIPAIAPFSRGQRVKALIDIYHFKKGETYTVGSCFCNQGNRGWNWWISAIEVPVTALAEDFAPQ